MSLIRLLVPWRAPTPSRRSVALATTGVALAGVGAVLSAAADAATSGSPNFREGVTCSAPEPIAVPSNRQFAVKLFVHGGHSAGGSIFVPTSYRDASGVTYLVQQWVVQYAAEGLGPHGKSGSFGASVGGRLAQSPIGADIPGRGITLSFDASRNPVPYTFQVSGPVTARVSINTYIGAMTRVLVRTYAGKTCPLGTTEVATIDSNGPPDPTPTPTTTPGHSASPSASPSSNASPSPTTTAAR